VARNEFRSDLYYRLNVFPIALPALRERLEDIPELVMHFVDVFSHRMGKRIDVIPEETMEAFRSYSWRGNIRELQNMIERAVILADEGVLPNPIPPTSSQKATSSDGSMTLKDSERALILRTLDQVGWVIGGEKGAAAKLGLKRTTLIFKMRKLGIERSTIQSNMDDVIGSTQQPEPPAIM
jgi:transcriptional regulator with GAF, ATPase, and Fis domain